MNSVSASWSLKPLNVPSSSTWSTWQKQQTVKRKREIELKLESESHQPAKRRLIVVLKKETILQGKQKVFTYNIIALLQN